MHTSSRITWYSAATMLAIGVAAALPPASPAAQVQIENYSNKRVWLAIAYNNYKGNTKLITEGWFGIDPNAKQTYNFANIDDAYLRLERDSDASEIVFSGAKLYWPTVLDTFTVSQAPDDNKILFLRWGPQLNNSWNMKVGQALPNGWTSKSFFRVGPNNRKLEITP
jgi:uncharacterized membrane protein